MKEETRVSLGRRPRGVSFRPDRGLAILIAGWSSLVSITSAEAQEWLKDRMYAEGAGVRTGDVEWHPGVAIEGGYDSNYWLRSDKNAPNLVNGPPNFPVQATPVMRVTPSLSLATLGQQRKEGDASPPPTVNFRLGASGTYREYFGQLSPEQRNFSADVNARLDILPARPVGGSVFASYDRVIQPNPGQPITNPDLAFDRDVLTVGAEIAVQPGGGMLDVHLGNTFTDTLFEQTAGQAYSSYLDTTYLKGRWKFRPRTALIYDGNFGIQHYDNTAGGLLAVTQLNDANPIRARLGISGLVTPRFSLLAMLGYGGSFLAPATPTTAMGEPPAQYDSVIGQGELKFYLTAQPGLESGPPSLTLSTLAVGYTRDFQNSYLANFYGSDRGYLKFSYFFGGRALVSFEGGGGAVEYPQIYYPNGTPLAYSDRSNPRGQGFTDLRIDTTLFGEYRFTNYLGVNLTAKYTTNVSDVILLLNKAQGIAQNYAMEWQHLEIYAGVRLFL
jgi:hypothetical protein